MSLSLNAVSAEMMDFLTDKVFFFRYQRRSNYYSLGYISFAASGIRENQGRKRSFGKITFEPKSREVTLVIPLGSRSDIFADVFNESDMKAMTAVMDSSENA